MTNYTYRTALAPGGLATAYEEDDPEPGVGDPGDEGRLTSDCDKRKARQSTRLMAYMLPLRDDSRYTGEIDRR